MTRALSRSIVMALALTACGGGASTSSSSSSAESSSATTGAEASAARASCTTTELHACEEYRGTVAAEQLDTRRTACADAGGTWADGACPMAGAIAGCEMQATSETGSAAGSSMVTYLYDGNPMLCQETPVRSSCEQGGGTYVEVSGAPAPNCPAP